MLLNDIRKSFLDYFKENNHKVLPSSPLIPNNDTTLHFTNAGMVQFKNQFIGIEKIKYPRIATSQKCIRAGGKHNDLQNVGYTARHHTFFEMLGNFSLGDYFKEKAIFYAWDYLTKELNIKSDKLYITVSNKDIEAFKIWKKVSGLDDNRIIKTSNNFWSMGASGPCGPCSEIFYDYGKENSGVLSEIDSQKNDRYVEIWNLVFMQYEKLISGEQRDIPKPSIDTGMGLERISTVIQGVNSNYQIDVFKELIDAISEISGNSNDITSHHIIADHIRSSCFLISDGVIPSNDGRGYVLRKIMRRAMRYVDNLRYNDTLLSKVAQFFIKKSSDTYSELGEAQELIISILNTEEEKFRNTLKTGIKFLNKEMNYLSKNGFLDGTKAFKLYDTYGFPVDLMIDILKEKNFGFDYKGFDIAMQKQKNKAQKSWNSIDNDNTTSLIWNTIYNKVGPTTLVIKNDETILSTIKLIIVNNKMVESVSHGDRAIVITDVSSFYAESGGQIGDQGKMSKSIVYNTKKIEQKNHAHFVLVQETLKVGDKVKLLVDYKLRYKIEANHSATHLLHHILKIELGNHVIQKGSMISDQKLRFDFTHNKTITKDKLMTIEDKINNIIISNISVQDRYMDINDAKKSGAIALFGEKYNNKVRVVSIGNSLELCGGTHVKYTGSIGLFVIISEESIANGIRRIEALTGDIAFKFLKDSVNQNRKICSLLKSSNLHIIENVQNLLNQVKKLKEINKVNSNKLLLHNLEKISLKESQILYLKLDEKDSDLKSIYNSLKDYTKTIVLLVNTSTVNYQTNLLIGVSKDIASSHYSAKRLIDICCKIINGKGGGSMNLAQASSKIINVEKKLLKALCDIL